MNRRDYVGIPWLGVDLDGTLAHYDGWKEGFIGEPVPRMMVKVRAALEQGKREGFIVKIFTARASNGPESIKRVQDWLERVGLPRLEVTNVKDFSMIDLWDDRCKQVVPNTGKFIREE